jgi:uroporphyrinogen-III synthase
MNILLTRPLNEAQETAKRLITLGYKPFIAPLFKVIRTDFIIPAVDYAGVIITSQHALDFVADDIITNLKNMPFFCVGDKAAHIIHTKLPDTKIISAPTSLDLLGHLRAINVSKPFLYMTAPHRTSALEHKIKDKLIIVETYENKALDELPHNAFDHIKKDHINYVLHYSWRSADIFMRLSRKAHVDENLSRMTHIAISQKAAQPLYGLPLIIAQQPDEHSMFDALRDDRAHHE